MRSLEEVKFRAAKLRKILRASGCDLKHSEAIEVIAKIDGHADWNAYAAFIKKNLDIAELYLDEMIEAENSGDYEKWIQRREKQYLGNFNERLFRRDLEDITDELGEYVSREYLGSITGYENSALEDRYPKAVRHLWRGVFDKNETLITCGYYYKNGQFYINECMYH